MIETIGWLSTALGITGAILNAKMSIKGFYVWLLSNATMVTISIVTKNYYLSLLFFVYFLLSIYGIATWRNHAKAQ